MSGSLLTMFRCLLFSCQPQAAMKYSRQGSMIWAHVGFRMLTWRLGQRGVMVEHMQGKARMAFRNLV